MNDRLKNALRRKINTHNRLVHLSTLGGALGAALMWAAIYFVGCWLPIFLLTVFRGLDAEPPANLQHRVILLMGAWMVVGWFDRQRQRSGEEGLDDRMFLGTVWRFAMLPPRMTFGVWDNPRNKVHLDEHELDTATEFIERLYRAGKLPAHSMPVELPEDDEREHILSVLRSTDIIRFQETEREDFFALRHPERVRAFV